MNITKHFLLSAALLAAVSCGSNSGNNQDSSAQTAADQSAPAAEVATKVSVVTAAVSKVPQSETFSASVQAYVTNNIVSQSSGRIRKINVEVGDFVQKGQVLAEMDRLQLDQAKLRLINDSTELTRIKQLYEQGGVSQSDYEQMQLSYNVSRTSYDNLVENTILRSPVSGVVTARNYDANDMYAMSLPIFTVQQITPVKVLVGISESDYTNVKRGDQVTLTAEALPGKTFTGKIVRLYPTMDAATHTFQTEVVINNPQRLLRPGMYVKVQVTFGVNENIVIPDTAVLKMQGAGQRYVFIVGADNRVEMRNVTVGRLVGTDYEITSGISAGEVVVVSGNIALKNGSLIEII